MSTALDAVSGVATRVRDLRAEHGLTQSQFGEVLGVDNSAVSRIESGTRGLAMAELSRLAARFDVSADFILFGEIPDEVLFRADGDTAEVVEFVKSVVDDVEFIEALLA